jgi:hypothetical protein
MGSTSCSVQFVSCRSKSWSLRPARGKWFVQCSQWDRHQAITCSRDWIQAVQSNDANSSVLRPGSKICVQVIPTTLQKAVLCMLAWVLLVYYEHIGRKSKPLCDRKRLPHVRGKLACIFLNFKVMFVNKCWVATTRFTFCWIHCHDFVSSEGCHHICDRTPRNESLGRILVNWVINMRKLWW